ncbi:MAG: hypothetical protein AAF804_14655, partial [Bacteroidota bacterium]
ADKTVYTALILCKQVFKWGYQEGKLRLIKLLKNERKEGSRFCFSINLDTAPVSTLATIIPITRTAAAPAKL